MRLSQYQSLHFERSTFIITPGHEVDAIEEVIEETDTHGGVKKHNIAAEPRLGADFNITAIDNS